MAIKSVIMLKDKIEQHKNHIIQILSKYLDKIPHSNSGEKEILRAIKHSLISKNAKYLRSFFVFEVAKMLNHNTQTNVSSENIKKLAIAIEMLHCYSLIHDDLPCMDNSDYRRNELSCHKKFTESTALMAGNALQVMAFDVLCDLPNATQLIRDFSQVVGIHGILSGQVLDLNPKYKREEFEEMNVKKTTLLIQFCFTSVAKIYEVKQDLLNNITQYGYNIGVAYQMKDDLLDKGEESYSYIDHLKSESLLQNALDKKTQDCVNLIKDFNHNQTFLELPKILANRIH